LCLHRKPCPKTEDMYKIEFLKNHLRVSPRSQETPRAPPL
jgi:hypothetical protein